MRRGLISMLSMCALCALPVAVDADEFKIIRLEQDVRGLEREVGTLKRQVADLERQLARTGERVPPRGERPAGSDDARSWLNAASWSRIRHGMNELEVIAILGQPTALRGAEDARTLLYTLEIGTTGFLSGSVQFANRRVTDVQVPILK